MKKLSELYTILLEDFKKRNEAQSLSMYSFLCNCLKQLHEDGIFNDDEFAYLLSHFMLQKPSRTVNTEFYKLGLFDGGYSWFYTIGHTREVFALRCQLLINIISKLKEESK